MLKTHTTRDLLAAWLLIPLNLFVGCGPGTVTERTNQHPGGSATNVGDSASAVTVDDPPAASKPVAPPVAPSWSHPIDSVPEGKIYRQAVKALDEGDFEQAAQLRSQLVGHPTFAVMADAISALMLVKQGQPDKALEAAQRVSRVPVMEAEAYLIAGEAFRAQGQWGEATAAFHGALQSHPEHLRAHRWLGAIYYDTGAMGLAVNHLRKVAELDLTDYRAFRLAGLIHYDYQKYDDAVQDYRQALQRPLPKPVENAIRLELADSLRELRQIDDALAVLQQCEPLADVLAMRAFCYESAGDDPRALELALEAIALEPQQRRANLVAGRIYLTERNWQQAIKHFRTVVQGDPTAHEPRFLLGRALLQSGAQQAGQAELERSTELKEMTLQLAQLHLEAMERPEDVGLRVRMGQLAEQLGRPRTAATWYRAARGLDPENPEATNALQRLQVDLARDPPPQPTGD